VLRDARIEAGLTLRQLETASGGRFKTSAVGGYERGERDISAVRLVELADALQTRPDTLVAAAMRKLQPDAYPPADVVTVRSGDLAVLATEVRSSPDDVTAGIEGAMPAPARRSQS
jgi:transcriptional regulator with XRE-family HTH domain